MIRGAGLLVFLLSLSVFADEGGGSSVSQPSKESSGTIKQKIQQSLPDVKRQSSDKTDDSALRRLFPAEKISLDTPVDFPADI